MTPCGSRSQRGCRNLGLRHWMTPHGKGEGGERDEDWGAGTSDLPQHRPAGSSATGGQVLGGAQSPLSHSWQNFPQDGRKLHQTLSFFHPKDQAPVTPFHLNLQIGAVSRPKKQDGFEFWLSYLYVMHLILFRLNFCVCVCVCVCVCD